MSSLALLVLPSCDLAGFFPIEDYRPAPGEPVPPEFSCGYEIEAAVRNRSGKYYDGWIELTNTSNKKGTQFELAVHLGNSTIERIEGAEFEKTGDGYKLTAHKSVQKAGIRPGKTHVIQFAGKGHPQSIDAVIRSINGQVCDAVAPDVSLTADQDFFTADGTLMLEADAVDGAGIRKVVFERDGEVIGEVTQAPFTLDVEITAASNGRHRYTATAIDQGGNSTHSEPVRVLVAIGNRFLGTAPGSAADFASMGNHFDQLTPEDAGKWGVVEATRDQMNWAQLDAAYAHAREHGMKFKLHTLVWGSQQPDWIATLSPEEQLAEVEEWFAEAAERYPDADLIDVVNEPLHAPPSYADALGGAGATGWDWVVRSFELARHYFPDSELLINDYQILSLEQFTDEYLAVIRVLQERDLVDGIGLQAHFYERAELPVVEANLAKLAATGLPIYISELDVDFADDARHANRLKDLVTIFFNEPAVVGVTHWGHLQGDVWRTNGYLIRTDGTLRPGMEWLLCAHAGRTDCTVPEYVPSGWRGTAQELVLESEDFDTAQGVIGSGSTISYTDDGDWIAYSDVEFQDGWDTFSVTYAKGNPNVGTISVHLDHLDAAPVLEVELPPTAGWGTTATIDLPWAPISGSHTVFVRFNDTYGVANLDKIRFSAPPEEPEPTVNLVRNGTFEVDTSGWTPWYMNPTLSVTSEMAHSGAQSLKISDRAADGGYNARYLLTDVVVPGTTYSVSAWSTIGGTAVGTARLAAVVQCANPPAGHNAYPWIQSNSNVTPGQWVQLSGTLAIPDCDLTEVSIYLEGAAAGVDMYLDDVEVLPPSSNLVQNAGFETGTAGWRPWYMSPTLTATSAMAYAGEQSLLVSNRTTGSGETAFYELTAFVQPGKSYSASAWVTIGGKAVDTVRLSGLVQCSDPPDGHNTYPWLHNNPSVMEGQWTQLSGTLAIPDCNLTMAAIYIDGPAAGTDIYVDEVYVGEM